jgi:DNA-binding IclR family transcriptional regulator
MFLQTRNGAGATINEICQATKAKYGTTHRLVKLFESKDMAVQSPDGRWHWKAKVEHQETLV